MKSSENIKDKSKDFIDSRLQLQINGKSYNTQSQALNWKHKQLIAYVVLLPWPVFAVSFRWIIFVVLTHKEPHAVVIS